MKKHILTFCALLMITSALLASDTPIVLAVAPFSHQIISRARTWDHLTPAIRDQVASELVRNYNCITLARSHGFSMAIEDVINTFPLFDNKEVDSQLILAADYSVSGSFQLAPNNKTECVILYTDLRSRSGATAKLTVIVPSVEDSAATIAAELTRALKLSRKTDETDTSSEVSAKELTWMVLPFTDMTNRKNLINTTGSYYGPLAVQAELTLQENTGIKRLVDHTKIDKILKEKKIHSLQSMTESMAGDIARIMGADRILMGAVSKSNGEKVRLDLMIIDAGSAVIINANNRICTTKNDLPRAIAALVTDTALNTTYTYQIPTAEPWQRQREARLYLDSAKVTFASLSLAVRLSGLEHIKTAYMLEHEDLDFVYSLGSTLRSQILKKGMPAPLAKHIVDVLDHMMADFPSANASYTPMIMLAEAYNTISDYSTAIQLAEKHLKNHPNIAEKQCYLVQAESYLGLKDPNMALSFTKKCTGNMRNSSVHFLEAKIYNALGDKEAEFNALNSLPDHWYHSFSDKLLRYMQLMLEIEGPEDTIRFIEKKQSRSSWYSSRAGIQYYLALAYLKDGNKKRAHRIASWLIKEAKNKDYRKRIQDILDETGDIKEDWLTAKETRPFPAKYALYLQPIGDVDTNILKTARSRVSEFYGAKVGILPALPLPKEGGAFHEKRRQYHNLRTLTAASSAITPPYDALSIGVIMRENMYANGLRYCFSSHMPDEGGFITSYFIWSGKSEKIISECLAKSIIGDFALEMGMRPAKHPCISSLSGDSGTIMRKRFAFAPDTQEKYKEVDFDETHKTTMRRLGSKTKPLTQSALGTWLKQVIND